VSRIWKVRRSFPIPKVRGLCITRFMGTAQSLQCYSCGAGVATDWPACRHCGVRLATIACTACFGMMFLGSKFCPHCGVTAVAWQPDASEAKCPQCASGMLHGQVGGTTLHECGRCFGLWLDKVSFDAVCRDQERQASMLAARPADVGAPVEPPGSIRYRRCLICSQLMNRVNYAHCSGVIVDVCARHGVWFDRNELQRIVAFIRQGGLDLARRREQDRLEAVKARLRWQQIGRPPPPVSYGYGPGTEILGGVLEIGASLITSLLD
jgi:Zn-finger nucleic acid-binding protein